MGLEQTIVLAVLNGLMVLAVTVLNRPKLLAETKRTEAEADVQESSSQKVIVETFATLTTNIADFSRLVNTLTVEREADRKALLALQADIAKLQIERDELRNEVAKLQASDKQHVQENQMLKERVTELEDQERTYKIAKETEIGNLQSRVLELEERLAQLVKQYEAVTADNQRLKDELARYESKETGAATAVEPPSESQPALVGEN